MPRTTIAVFGAGGVGVSTGPASAGLSVTCAGVTLKSPR